MTIKDRLSALTAEQLNRLTYAHQYDITQAVDLPDGKFIGVNIPPSKMITVLESTGQWSYGIKYPPRR